MNRIALQITLALGAVATVAGSCHAAPLTPAQRAKLFSHVPPSQVLSDTDGNGVQDALEAKLAVRGASARADVVVRYKPGFEAASGRIADRVTRHLEADGSVAARLTRKEIQALLASGVVRSVEENAVFHAVRDTSQASSGTTKASADFGLTGDRDGDPNRYTAQDLTIAVIDTGIDLQHPDFAGGKIIGWKDFINKKAQPYDDQGHGTHCASIAAAKKVNGIGGVAPGASLVGVKVLDEDGWGRSDVIADAIDWCVQNRAQLGIEILSLSLGSDGSSDGTDVVSRAVNRAVEAGLIVCVAAGNEGPGKFTIGSPAAAERAITVGNMIDPGKGGFAINDSSSRGPTADMRVKPDVCAPGTEISAAQANTGGYVRFTGTSMACPFVAGVAALMLQANPGLAPQAVKDLMKQTAVHFGPAGENNDFGAGRLDGYAVLAAASGTQGTAPVAPDHLFREGSLSGDEDSQKWNLPVDDTQFALAVTLLMEDDDVDFDLYVYDPQGEIVAYSEDYSRQETILLEPTATGTYVVEVYSYSGSGRYTLDISAGSSLE